MPKSQPSHKMVFGVGMQKTGTSSLREALTVLGYTVKDTTPRALLPILRGNYPKVMRILKGYDAAEDTPWFKIYKELDRCYPGSKFILTQRDEQQWYRSVSKHIGALPAAHHEWIYGPGKSVVKDHPENTLRVYREHNGQVKEYFSDRPDDLLVIDFTTGEGWKKLCRFLDKPVPEVDFPHSNNSAESEWERQTVRYKRKIVRQGIKNRWKIRTLRLLGYLREK